MVDIEGSVLRAAGVFFFFKQKTAYEMCGRDWSSDVCSSDLFVGRLSSVVDTSFCLSAYSGTKSCRTIDQVPDSQFSGAESFPTRFATSEIRMVSLSKEIETELN